MHLLHPTRVPTRGVPCQVIHVFTVPVAVWKHRVCFERVFRRCTFDGPVILHLVWTSRIPQDSCSYPGFACNPAVCLRIILSTYWKTRRPLLLIGGPWNKPYLGFRTWCFCSWGGFFNRYSGLVLMALQLQQWMTSSVGDLQLHVHSIYWITKIKKYSCSQQIETLFQYNCWGDSLSSRLGSECFNFKELF